jgi:hypothetical protein
MYMCLAAAVYAGKTISRAIGRGGPRNDRAQKLLIFLAPTPSSGPRKGYPEMERCKKKMQLHTGAEHFGNVIFRYSELPSTYHIDASIDVNRPRQDCDITCLLYR